MKLATFEDLIPKEGKVVEEEVDSKDVVVSYATEDVVLEGAIALEGVATISDVVAGANVTEDSVTAAVA